jgi:small-conductance mechanosensitive channel
VSSPESVSRDEAETAENFYRSVLRRLFLAMAALALVLTPAIWIRYGAAQACGFLLGSVVAIANFYWLRRTVEALGHAFAATGRKPSSARVITRFLLRYVLIALAAYVILKRSPASLYGLIAGLSLPVAAILIEAVYETSRTLRAEL